MNKLDRIGQKSVLYQIQTILLDEIDSKFKIQKAFDECWARNPAIYQTQ